MKKSPQLTHTENRILQMTANGYTSAEILGRLEMTPQALHVHWFHIRQKTGISDTTNQQECRNYIRSFRRPGPHAMPKDKATPAQEEVMDYLFVKGFSIPDCARLLKKSKQTIMNTLCAGCQRAGITSHGEQRAMDCRAYLAERYPEEVKNPMNDPFL